MIVPALDSLEYRRHREQIGTQQFAADQLGVDRITINRRENDALPITKEAALAMLALGKFSMMNRIYHATDAGEPGEAHYGIFLDYSTPVQTAVIVAGGSYLFNADRGRDALLNRIIATELPGVRIEFVRFIAVPDYRSDNPHGKKFKIHPNLDEVRKKQSLLRRRDPIWSGSLLGGEIRVHTLFDDGEMLTPVETIEALKCAGIR